MLLVLHWWFFPPPLPAWLPQRRRGGRDWWWRAIACSISSLCFHSPTNQKNCLQRIWPKVGPGEGRRTAWGCGCAAASPQDRAEPRLSSPHKHQSDQSWMRSRKLPPGGFLTGRSRRVRQHQGPENPACELHSIHCTRGFHLLKFVCSWCRPIGQLPWCWHYAILIVDIMIHWVRYTPPHGGNKAISKL